MNGRLGSERPAAFQPLKVPAFRLAVSNWGRGTYQVFKKRRIMGRRSNFPKLTPEPLKVMYSVGAYLAGCGLEKRLRQQFSRKKLVDLNWSVVAINAWNRIANSFRRTS
jgi:hypothetical protein